MSIISNNIAMYVLCSFRIKIMDEKFQLVILKVNINKLNKSTHTKAHYDTISTL